LAGCLELRGEAEGEVFGADFRAGAKFFEQLFHHDVLPAVRRGNLSGNDDSGTFFNH